MSDTNQGRPVIALMGEFSAGKSTLANLLLGEGHSPVKVTATQLPPVWFSYGDGDSYAMNLDGNPTPISVDDLESVDVATTRYIKIFAEADLLSLMDVIDMPGNSDPNMSADVWRRMIHKADGVIWCTHANQAWRQSEAAVWDEMSPELQQNSILLLTRFDKIIGDSNRQRVLRRVSSEAGDLFRAILPISLLDALNSGEDRSKWEDSGAEAFVQELLDLVVNSGPLEIAKPKTERPVADFSESPSTPERDLNAGPVLPRRVGRPSESDSVVRRPSREDTPTAH